MKQNNEALAQRRRHREPASRGMMRFEFVLRCALTAPSHWDDDARRLGGVDDVDLTSKGKEHIVRLLDYRFPNFIKYYAISYTQTVSWPDRRDYHSRCRKVF